MPKYNIVIRKVYEVETDGRTVEDAKKNAWETHMKMLAKGEDFPKVLRLDHKRVRTEDMSLSSNQKKRLARKLKELEANVEEGQGIESRVAE